MQKSHCTLIAITTLILAIVIFSSSFITNKPTYQVASGNHVSTLPVITHATVESSEDNEVKVIDIPFSKQGTMNELLQFALSVQFQKGQSTLFRVIPDDCVENFIVNGQSLWERSVWDKSILGSSIVAGDALPSDLCNWQTGFVIDLQPFLREGNNEIYLQIRNKEGLTGLEFMPEANP